jgi:hypothetical protein
MAPRAFRYVFTLLPRTYLYTGLRCASYHVPSICTRSVPTGAEPGPFQRSTR